MASVDLREIQPQLPGYRILKQLWSQFHTHTTGLTRDHYDQLGRFLSGSDGHRYSLPNKWTLERVGTWVHLHRLVDLSAPGTVATALDQRTSLPWIGGHVGPAATKGPLDARELWLDDSTRTKVGTWRGAQPDDRIRTREGHTPVMELLRSAGIPTVVRPRYPLLAVDGEVWWIPALRMSATLPRPTDGKNLERGIVLRLTTSSDASPEAFLMNRVVETYRRG